MWHGLERERVTTKRTPTTVPGRGEVRATFPWRPNAAWLPRPAAVVARTQWTVGSAADRATRGRARREFVGGLIQWTMATAALGTTASGPEHLAADWQFARAAGMRGGYTELLGEPCAAALRARGLIGETAHQRLEGTVAFLTRVFIDGHGSISSKRFSYAILIQQGCGSK